MTKTFLIAEVGSNHGGDLESAKTYIRAAKDAGADAVKFQTLAKEKLISPQMDQDGRLVDNPGWKIFSNLPLLEEWHPILKRTADECGIEFMSTPFYLEAVDLLEACGVQTHKIASGDITFVPLLEKVGKTGKRVILSTGASDLVDIRTAVNILKKAGSSRVDLLHCVTNYPPVWEEMNLRSIVTMKNEFHATVGISDHTPGSIVPLACVALGGEIIEKHVTFDRSSPGPDHPYAMTFEEFRRMSGDVRLLEKALGDGIKKSTPKELEKQKRLRRGIYDGLWLRPQRTK